MTNDCIKGRKLQLEQSHPSERKGMTEMHCSQVYQTLVPPPPPPCFHATTILFRNTPTMLFLNVATQGGLYFKQQYLQSYLLGKVSMTKPKLHIEAKR